MPNLLPIKNKKSILREFILRFVIVFLTLFFAVVCIAIVLLIPSYILSQVREFSIESEVAIFEKVYEFRKENSSASMLDSEILKMKILQKQEETNVSELIYLITKNNRENIKIFGIFYEITPSVDKMVRGKVKETVKGKIQVTIRGEADKRNSLIDFVNRLKQEDLFTSVDFPVSNLIKGEELNFTIQISIKSNLI